MQWSEEAVCSFLAWWSVAGKNEYPAAIETVDIDTQTRQQTWLMAEPDALSQQGDALPPSRFFYGIWLLRTDLQQHFDIRNADSCRAYARWLISFGLKEFGDALQFSEAQRQMLLRSSDETPSWTNAMRLLWEAHAEFQKSYPIDDLSAVVAFADWYIQTGQREWNHDRIANRRIRTTPMPPGFRIRKERLPKLTLVGAARGELGLGEDVRMAALACKTVGLPFEVYDVPNVRGRQQDLRLETHLVDEPAGKCNLFCMTLFDIAHVYLQYPDLFSDAYNIGYCPWELAELPEEWEPALDFLDEIWASTRFTEEAFARTTRIPVRLMPMAVDATLQNLPSRQVYGLEDERVLFLYVFDWKSYPARKNPMAAVNAFQEAFDRRDRSVQLILKTMDLDRDNPGCWPLLEAADLDSRIVILDNTMNRNEILGLIGVCDAMISLHRSEGFGRTLAEAMLLKKPVIATAYSGNLDFCSEETAALVPASLVSVGPKEYPYGDGQVWASPDIAAAAAAMRKIRDETAYATSLGMAGSSFIATHHNPSVVGTRYRQRLSQLGLP